MEISELITKIITGAAPCVLGLDVGYSELPGEFMRGHADKAEAVRAFNRLVINTLSDIVPAISVNVEALMPYGIETVADAISYAKEKGLFTIADVKCSGEPRAAEASAELYFDTIDADCITVSPYYGTAGVAPILEKSKKEKKSVFVLAHSDSGTPQDVQDLVTGVRTVYRAVCERASRWGEKRVGSIGYSDIGIIIGGVPNSVLAELRRTYKKMLFLITGYDGDKTRGHDINGAFDMRGLGGLVYVTREITLAKGSGAYSERIRNAAEEVVKDLRVCF